LSENLGKDKSLNEPYPLILASTSKYRAELLARLNIPFECLSPGINEDILKAEPLTPSDLATRLSHLKAQAVFVQKPGSCVIGSDQVCELEGIILGKPGSIERAIDQLSFMQGKTHQLLTAFTVITPENKFTHLNTTTLRMKNLRRDQIRDYVMKDRPIDCAGSYKIESAGDALFEEINTEDETAIIGLPMKALEKYLKEIGFN
jgi:septum formation protein